MLVYEGETTDRALLDRLGDWADQCAWSEFVQRYDPEIRRHCRAYRFDPETLEEVCQRVWIDLARCLRSYRYDPGRRFRAWLRRLCRSRSVDFLRQRRSEAVRRAGEVALDLSIAAPAVEHDLDEQPETERPSLLLRAERIQESVRCRVDGRTWRVFWSIAIDERSVREVADEAGLSYAAAFAAQKRVRRMLREEAARRPFPPAPDAS